MLVAVEIQRRKMAICQKFQIYCFEQNMIRVLDIILYTETTVNNY